MKMNNKSINTKSSLALALALASGMALARNVIPNPSFEDGTDVPGGDFVTNVDPEFHTSGWKGGILTAGGNKTFCPLPMADGQYGMALHYVYPSASNGFVLEEDGLYRLKFRYTPRHFEQEYRTYGMYVKVRFDESTEDVVKVESTNSQEWAECVCFVELKAGSHTITFLGELKPGVSDASMVVDAVSLESIYECNLVPNASFEEGTDISDRNFETNVEPDFHTSGWKGGILTCGGEKTFCKPKMYDGQYGMALHWQYPSTEIDVSVPVDGRFVLSFAGTSRAPGQQTACRNTVTAYIDDIPVASLLPDSWESWETRSGRIRLQRGTHRLKFVGVVPSGIDSSTVIDGIELRALPEKGLAILFR